MNRRTFQELAEIRLIEAETLLHSRLYCGAYYLAGYAAECGLKACVAREFDFPPDRRFSERVFVHDLVLLMKELVNKPVQIELEDPSGTFKTAWSTVGTRSETSRYHLINSAEATQLFQAAQEVLTCIRRHW